MSTSYRRFDKHTLYFPISVWGTITVLRKQKVKCYLASAHAYFKISQIDTVLFLRSNKIQCVAQKYTCSAHVHIPSEIFYWSKSGKITTTVVNVDPLKTLAHCIYRRLF